MTACLSQRITLPSLASSTYYVHTTLGSWRGPANSIYQAFILARYAGIRGHVIDIIKVGEIRPLLIRKLSFVQRVLAALGF